MVGEINGKILSFTLVTVVNICLVGVPSRFSWKLGLPKSRQMFRPDITKDDRGRSVGTLRYGVFVLRNKLVLGPTTSEKVYRGLLLGEENATYGVHVEPSHQRSTHGN